MPKHALRRELLGQRSALDETVWQRNSLAAQRLVLELPEFRQAVCLALYAPIRGEVDTTLLLSEALAAGKQVLYPLVCGAELRFHRIHSLDQLAQGSFGIPEPCPVRCAAQQESFDLLVAPGVAFDRCGHRIGFGKGYYDRYLSGLHPLPCLVGLCHEFQLRERLPAEGHDIRMDYVVSDQRVIRTGVTDRIGRPDDHIIRR